MAHDLAGVRLLDAFLRNRAITNQAAADALKVSRPSVLYWRTGERLPDAAARVAIELWTGGSVPESSWLSDEERARLAALIPHDAQRAPAGEPAQSGASAQVGADDSVRNTAA